MKPLMITPRMRANWKKFNAARVADDKPKLNFPLWVKVRNRIAAVPESYDQTTFKRRSKIAPCGTVACLAGETIICAAPSVKKGVQALFSTRYGSVSGRAENLLGLGLDGCGYESEIFAGDGTGWPEPYFSMYDSANSQRQQARAAVAYLTHVIRTGKVLE